ncbi:ATP-grasp domain-containing protein [Streptomyces sp. APSN-46.1]|uniref:carboxylate--amine ligase n=1 Tax=Streptomyces sp. APSN-46.1 TaxID=2929049 RepID=UPI002436A331|nr:ATP-grasp domain-containing protein [Streptomyces sp. APSN-46.1]
MGRSRYLRAVHPGPDRGLGGLDPEAPEALLECLVGVSERIGRPAVLVAMDDLSAIIVARISPMLGERFRIPHQPDGLPARVADKAELSRLCARWGIPHPETVIPASGAEAAEAAWRLGLPAVAKWSRPWMLPAGTGLRSTTLVHSAAEARRLYERSAEAGSRLLLQRFLPAGPDTDWFFHGAFARGGRPLLAGSGRKELSWPVRTGLTAVGRWLPDPVVEEAGLRIAERLGYQGILDLDFRRDERGCFRLVDFNPRPGAQFRLFTDAAGLDVVQAMYLDLTGQRVPEPSGGPGRVFVAENYALLAAVRGRQLPFRRTTPAAVVPGVRREGQGQSQGHGQSQGPGQRQGLDQGQSQGQRQGLDQGQGQGQGHGPGHGHGHGHGHGPGQRQGPGQAVPGVPEGRRPISASASGPAGTPPASGRAGTPPGSGVPEGRRPGAVPGPGPAWARPAAGPGARPGPVRVVPRGERGRVEAAWFATDDPLPFLAMLAAFLGRGAGKGARALRGVPAHGRRTARAVGRAPRQRASEPTPPATPPASPPTAPPPAPPAAAAPDELVTR